MKILSPLTLSSFKASFAGIMERGINGICSQFCPAAPRGKQFQGIRSCYNIIVSTTELIFIAPFRDTPQHIFVAFYIIPESYYCLNCHLHGKSKTPRHLFSVVWSWGWMWSRYWEGKPFLSQLLSCHWHLVYTGLHCCETKLYQEHYLPSRSTFHM